MPNNGLYINIVDATANIVKQFGRITVHEERLVNILSDMYPERTLSIVPLTININ